MEPTSKQIPFQHADLQTFRELLRSHQMTFLALMIGERRHDVHAGIKPLIDHEHILTEVLAIVTLIR